MRSWPAAAGPVAVAVAGDGLGGVSSGVVEVGGGLGRLGRLGRGAQHAGGVEPRQQSEAAEPAGLEYLRLVFGEPSGFGGGVEGGEGVGSPGGL